MSLDIFAIGPPEGGLFLFGRKAGPPRDDSAVSSGEKAGEEQPGSAPRPRRHVPLNPHVEALRMLERLEHQRQVIAPFFASGPRQSMGSQIDLRA